MSAAVTKMFSTSSGFKPRASARRTMPSILHILLFLAASQSALPLMPEASAIPLLAATASSALQSPFSRLRSSCSRPSTCASDKEVIRQGPSWGIR